MPNDRAIPSPADLIAAAYDSYADAIFRHCALRLFSRERAKELMQDTFIRTFEYVRKGHAVENMRALLYRIANNLIIDDIRRRHEESLDALEEAGFSPMGDDGTAGARSMEDERVRLTLQKLPTEERDLIILRYVDGMKPQEIASLRGLSANVVSVRLHRAMQTLRQHLSPPEQAREQAQRRSTHGKNPSPFPSSL